MLSNVYCLQGTRPYLRRNRNFHETIQIKQSHPHPSAPMPPPQVKTESFDWILPQARHGGEQEHAQNSTRRFLTAAIPLPLQRTMLVAAGVLPRVTANRTSPPVIRKQAYNAAPDDGRDLSSSCSVERISEDNMRGPVFRDHFRDSVGLASDLRML